MRNFVLALVSGWLSVASTAMAAEARVVLDGPRGAIEQRPVMLEGLPVRGVYETWRRARAHLPINGPHGSASTATPVVRGPALAQPEFMPHEAEIPAADVESLVARALGRPSARLRRPPRLVYQVVLGQPVLAWEADVQVQLRPEPSAPRVWLSAMTGHLLGLEERLMTARADVFPENPSRTPEPIEAELTGLGVVQAGRALTGERLQVYNCSDRAPETIVPWHDEGACYPVQIARADAVGDYRAPVPRVVRLEDNIQPEDAYAEVSAYYHAERFLTAMQARGVSSVACDALSILTNYRGLTPDPTRSTSRPFEPYDNAFFVHECDAERGVTMVFGQGTDVDFAYDGDVVYHELGHGVVATVTPEGLHRANLRHDAVLEDAGALNEAVADYLAMALTGDPDVGDYVGRFWGATARPFIRSANNERVCPDDMLGEVHADAEPMMAALWSARTHIGPVLDDVVLEALSRCPGDASLEQASALFLEVAEAFVASGLLQPRDPATLRRALEARNLLDCTRVITEPDAVSRGRTMFLRRAHKGVDPFFPGPMQLRYEVPEGDTKAWVVYELFARKGDVEPTAKVLVKTGDEPIAFSYDLVQTTSESGKSVTEVIEVSGDWDREFEAAPLGAAANIVEIDGLEGGQVLHVMLVNTANVAAVATKVRVVPAEPFPAEELPETTGAEADDTGAAAGCACSAGPSTGPWWLLALAFVHRSRARRTNTNRSRRPRDAA